jgi:hypothetical protein
MGSHNRRPATAARALAAAGLAAASLVLPAAAGADPVGDAFVVEQYAHEPNAAWGNGTFLAEFTLEDDTAVRRLGAGGVSGPTSPVLPGENGDIAFNTSREEWLVVASDRASVRATAIAADGSRRAPVTLTTAPDDESLWEPKVAYTSGQYLVSWRRERDRGPSAAVEARRLTSSGALAGPTIGVSDSTLVSTYGDATDVVKGPSGGFLVAWTIVRDDETEDVVGQRISSSGAEIGTDDFRISSHTNLVGRAENNGPAVAWNSARSEWMAVYSDRYEIFGQRLSSSGSRVGGPVRLSQVGPDGDARWLAETPDIAYNTRARDYLVVWIGTTRLAEEMNDNTVFGQHVGPTGSQRGTNDFTLSAPHGAEFLGGASVAQHNDRSEYMVLWHLFENELQARRVLAP